MESLFFHPKIVHLPMALAVLMPLIAGGLALSWWRKWLQPRAWMVAVALQVVLVGSGIMAMRTGEAEEERVEEVVAERHIEEHEEAAEVFVWASGLVLAVMLAGLVLGKKPAGLPLAAAAVLGTIVVLGLGYRTGQEGGALVYRHGAAGAYVTAGGGGPAGDSEGLPGRGGSDEEGDDDDDDD